MSSPAETTQALAAHAERVAALRRPGALAHTAAAVDLVETHLSSLLMAGEHVYKLKKPVVLGFVDFSTLAARREACEEELRLNRRTAARWYLGVVPVVMGADGPRLDGPGPVLDWAVHMRRFDDTQRYDRLASQGRLAAQHIDPLVAAVHRFHAHLPPAPPGHGRADGVRHWARENLAELAPLLHNPREATLLAALAGWTEARGAELAPLMELRRLTGHVRECHGDLHLANIAWVDEAPLLFDALEFNETLRHLDTIGELAFTFMDLLAHGQPRLGWRFLSGALEASGDHEALPLLAWHAVYRALVRAKVALLPAVAAPPPGGPGTVADAQPASTPAQALASRYLQLAAELAGLVPAPQGLPRPMLLLCGGVSGAGKSTVAGWLAERWGAVRVRSDVERKRLHGLAPTARPVSAAELYGAEATRRTYQRLQEVAALALSAGESIVVDAACLRRDERLAMQALARRHGAAYRLVWCEAPLPVMRQRLVARLAEGRDPSDATPEVLAWQMGIAEWPAADEEPTLWRVSTDRPLPALLQHCEALATSTRADGAAEEALS
ncbi:MAG: AAA family ATPase [Burkholderiales bacterium]|nr:AAA family ATPase [Burkholderiales bacterium]